MNPITILETIEKLDRSKIQLVAFTGGEPFLFGKQLVDFVRCASIRGFTTRIVTSGYFGLTPQAAEIRIGEVVSAGLNQLSISWDDFHEVFVKFETIKNVVTAARKFKNLSVAVNIVQGKDSKWNVNRVRRELGLGFEDAVTESPLNLTGRAEEELQDVGLRDERFLGPCPYVLTGPTLSAKNKLLACCGVIPDTDRLCIDGIFDPDRLEA